MMNVMGKFDILCDNSDEAILFASDELKKYSQFNAHIKEFSYILSSSVICAEQHNIDTTKILHDGFVIKKDNDTIIIYANIARGVLFGVYEVLARFGISFIRAAGVTQIVKDNLLELDDIKYYNPDFSIRTVANGVGVIDKALYLELCEVIDWCAKNKINTLFIHQGVDIEPNEYLYNVMAEIHKRGMRIEYGGHGVQNFLSRALFEEHPEYFIFKNGERTKIGNFCVSSVAALDIIVEKTIELVSKLPTMDMVHFWFDDAIDGSWCECEKCKKILPIRQQSIVINYISDKLKTLYPTLKYEFLLYHETIEHIHEIENLKGNVYGLFAPRERCYAHSLADCNCKLNTKYLSKLKKVITKFKAEKTYIFDYYFDFILFDKVKCFIPDVIKNDLSLYKSLGVDKICSLGFGLYSFWAYELNMHLYAALAFNVNSSIDELIRDYMSKLELPREFYEYYELLKTFSEKYFAFCGYNGAYADIRRVALCDYMGEHVKLISEGIDSLTKAQALLEKAISNDNNKNYIMNEKTIINISLIEAKNILLRMSVRFKNFDSPEKDNEKYIDMLKPAKKGLHELIQIIEKVPSDVKGENGKDNFIAQLCLTQIWTINEFLNQEFGLNTELDMPKILKGDYLNDLQ